MNNKQIDNEKFISIAKGESILLGGKKLVSVIEPSEYEEYFYYLPCSVLFESRLWSDCIIAKRDPDSLFLFKIVRNLWHKLGSLGEINRNLDSIEFSFQSGWYEEVPIIFSATFVFDKAYKDYLVVDYAHDKLMIDGRTLFHVVGRAEENDFGGFPVMIDESLYHRCLIDEFYDEDDIHEDAIYLENLLAYCSHAVGKDGSLMLTFDFPRYDMTTVTLTCGVYIDDQGNPFYRIQYAEDDETETVMPNGIAEED